MSSRLLLSEKKKVNGQNVIFELYSRAAGDREIYADGIQGMMVKDGIAKLNFFTDRISAPDEAQQREVVFTLVVPVQQLKAISGFLANITKQMEAEGQ